MIRERAKAWRAAGYPGVTRTTLELLQWWQRDGRTVLECAAAQHWAAAVNADGTYGCWQYAVAKKVSGVKGIITAAAQAE